VIWQLYAHKTLKTKSRDLATSKEIFLFAISSWKQKTPKIFLRKKDFQQIPFEDFTCYKYK